MSKLIEIIKRCKKERSLGINAFVYFLYKTKICSKYTAGLISMDYIFYKIKKKYHLKAKKYAQQCGSNQLGKMSKTVWLFWWQGIESAPELVKKCYESVQKNFSGWNIVVIDQKNYKEYLELPISIIKKHESGIITHTHFSDILRLALLCRYGGVWLDATVYCTGKLNQEFVQKDLFCYRNGWMDQESINFASWFIISKPNEPILSASLMLLFDYWETHDYLIHYFLLHMFVKLISDELNEKWREIPYYNHNDNHLLAEELPKEWDKRRVEGICRLTNFHKLSYKINVDLSSNNTTYYHVLRGDLLS